MSRPRALLLTRRRCSSCTQLVVGRGQSVERPLENVTFRGITFEHTTWLGPNSPDGYVPLQANVRAVGQEPRREVAQRHLQAARLHGWQVRLVGKTTQIMGNVAAITGMPCQNLLCEPTPAALAFHMARGIVIDQCVIARSGSAGVYLGDGAQHCAVRRSELFDLSASAVAMGRVDTWHVTDPALQEVGNVVEECWIHDTAREFHGAAAIWAGFWKGGRIVANTIERTSYAGVHVGWGWALDEGYSAQNEVGFNRIDHHMQVLSDGGGVYVTGPQPGTTIHDNYVSGRPRPKTADGRPSDSNSYEHGGGCLYFDEGASFISASENVCDLPHPTECDDNDCPDAYFTTGGSPAAHPTVHDVVVRATYSNNLDVINRSLHSAVEPAVDCRASWPPEAVAIMARAGSPSFPLPASRT